MRPGHQYATRGEWLAARGIGGSDVAKILGTSPHGSAWSVWSRLVRGMEDDDKPTADMDRGRRWEPLVLAVYQGETGTRVRAHHHEIWRHPAHPFATASLDASIPEDDGIIEAKTDMSPQSKLWGESREIEHWDDAAAAVTRPDYVVQTYWNTWVAGASFGDLVVLTPFYELLRYRLHADAEVFGALEYEIGEWYRRHVVADVPPPVDGTGACFDWLSAKFREGDQGHRLATDAEAAKIRRYAALKAAIKQAKDECDELKAQLLAAAGDADVIPLVEPRIKRTGEPDLKGVPRLTVVRQRANGGLDYPALARDYPDLDLSTYRLEAGISVRLMPYNIDLETTP